jgi:sugar phosphate permease
MVLATVPLFHAMSVWAVALERNFGWSRTQLSLALTFTRVEGGVMGPLEGYLSDRIGTRRMVSIGLLILAAGFFLFGQVQNLWMFYLAFVVMSLGQGLGGWVPLMTLLNHWFVRRRAMAMGLAMMGSGLGALLLVPAIAWAIDPDHDRLGWRLTATIIGGVAIAAALTIPRFIRNRPQDYNLRPDGDPPSAVAASAGRGASPARRSAAEQGQSDLTTGQALRTPAFWLISLGHGLGSMVILAIMTHLGLLIVNDRGYGVQTAAWVVTVYTGVGMVFQLLGGYVGDRIPKRVALFIFTGIQGGAVVLLAFSSTLTGFFLFAILFGIGFGGRTPLTTAIRGEYFGRASFGKILGVSTVPMNILLLIAGPLAGYMRDVQGTYKYAFLVLAGLNCIGAVLFLFAKKPTLRPATPRSPVAESAG